MFGYVRPELPEREMKQFRRVYCGLCHTLGRRYGPAARCILNYDFTFLAILLSDGNEAEAKQSRCVVHPVHGREHLCSSAALELAADESVILAYWQLRDGVEDHDWFHGLKYRGFSSVLESAYRKAAAARPDFDRSVCRQLEALAALERENCPSIDQPAEAFAMLLREASGAVDHPIRRRVLEQILYHLGRWIYLIDAADDLQRDAASGNYNPVALRFGLQDGQWTEESCRDFALTLDQSIHMMTTAFELWDFGVWTPLLQETLYGTLFRVGRAVLDGTFHKAQRRGLSGAGRDLQEQQGQN